MKVVYAAYIFINAEPGKLWKVADEAKRIDGIRMAHAVTGPFDVILYVEFLRMEDLGKIIDQIHALSGVLRTQTAVAMPSRLPLYDRD